MATLTRRRSRAPRLPALSAVELASHPGACQLVLRTVRALVLDTDVVAELPCALPGEGRTASAEGRTLAAARNGGAPAGHM